MRKILFILVFPLALATPIFQSIANMGIDARVSTPEKNGEWIIPYEFGPHCTAFAVFYLRSGILKVYNNGKEIIEGTKPGTYRSIIDRNGALRVILEREQGERSAEIDGNSFIACADIPFLDVNAHVPSIFDVGGFTDIVIIIRNRGTGGTEANIIFQLPEELAPLEPPPSIYIGPLEEKKTKITILTAEEFSPRLFHPICLQYRDDYGEWSTCTDEYITTGKIHVPLVCFIHNKEIGVLNRGTIPIRIAGLEILPKDMQTYQLRDVNSEDICDFSIKIKKRYLEPIEDLSWLSALFLALSGVLGVVMSEKRIKIRNA